MVGEIDSHAGAWERGKSVDRLEACPTKLASQPERYSVRRNQSCSRGRRRSGFAGPCWGRNPDRNRDRGIRS
jgi:hypothetical protein